MGSVAATTGTPSAAGAIEAGVGSAAAAAGTAGAAFETEVVSAVGLLDMIAKVSPNFEEIRTCDVKEGWGWKIARLLQ